MKRFVVLLGSFFVLSCTSKVPVFNGDLVTISSVPETIFLSGKEIKLNDIFAGYMSVYDSLILFKTNSALDHWMYVFNVNSGDLVGQLCPKGRGPEDFLDFYHSEQYCVKDNDIKLWIYDQREKIYLLNLTQSIERNKTIIDTLIVQEWMNYYTSPCLHLFFLDFDHFIIQNQSGYVRNSDQFHFSAYHLYEKTIGNEMERFDIFNRLPIGQDDYMVALSLYSSFDRMNNQRNKIAMGMMNLSQINILDVQSKKIKGFRFKNTPDFDELPEKAILSYLDICVDDRMILCLFSNPEHNSSSRFFKSDVIHIFDWDGHFTHKIKLDHLVNQITFDPVRKYLYGLTEYGEIYQWSLFRF